MFLIVDQLLAIVDPPSLSFVFSISFSASIFQPYHQLVISWLSRMTDLFSFFLFGSFLVLLDEYPSHRHAQKSGNTLITDITAYKFLMILSKSLHLFALCRHKVENAPLLP